MMKNIFYSFVLICAFVMPAHAKMEPVLNKDSEVRAIESYLNNLSTVKARFVQTAPDGTQMDGTFYLSRPGKLRFEYDDPIDDFVVADGVFIYFYDAELGEQTNAPIGQTLADFLLRDDIKLSDDIHVDEVKHGGGFLQIGLSQSADPASGQLMMAFHEKPLALRKWRIIDAQGMITEVELSKLETDVDLPGDLFTYIDPSHGVEPSYNE